MKDEKTITVRENPPESVRGIEFGTFWQGSLDPLTYTCIASFPYYNANLTVYSYDLGIKVPPGVHVADARLIIPDETWQSRYLVNGRPSFARFANLFRYEMIRLTGVCWVDTDIMCLKTPELPADGVIFGRQDDWSKHAFNVAVLRFPSDHPVLARLIQEAGQAIDVDAQWGTLGPMLLTRLVRECGIEYLSASRKEFYPIPPGKFWKMLLPGYCERVCSKTCDSTFVHLWNQMFKWSGYDHSIAPPSGSFLYQQCLKLGTLPLFKAVYEKTQLREILADAINE